MLLFMLSLILLSILIFTSLFTYYTKNVEHLSIYHSPFEISNIQNLELYNDQADYTPFVNYKNYPILQEDDPNFSETGKFPLIKSIEYEGKQTVISVENKNDAYTGEYTGDSNPMTTTMTTRSNIKSPVTTNSNTSPAMAGSSNITGAIPVTASTIPNTTYTIVPPMTTSF